jgi:hypothetical protein
MRNASGTASILACAFLFAACGTVLYDHPTTRQADGWTITVTRLKDGPNSFPMGAGVTFVPPDGHRLLFLTLSVRNDTGVKREFSWDACDLDAGAETVLPGMVDRDMAIHALADKVEDFDPGEARGRRLLYAYPGEGYPTRVKCGLSTFEFPKF